MVDNEPIHRRHLHHRYHHLHHHHQQDRVSSLQSTPFLILKQGSDLHLQGGAPHKQIAAFLQPKHTVSHSQSTSPWYGRAGIALQEGAATQAMTPASSDASPPSAASAHDLRDNSKSKVVIRGLPPSLSEKDFRDSVIPRFDELLKWVSFCPGKVSIRKCRDSRAYVDFAHPEDVFKFYEQFNGHVFVNEKGARYKALVYYAPHQRVPTPSVKKDNEEGSILEDPEYSEFVSGLSKPTEFLPSAEVQLERREAEKRLSLGAAKETIIVTPLMQHVRQTRALKDQKVSMANRRKHSCQGNSAVMNSAVLPKGLPEISRGSIKYAPKAAETEKLTYAPRSAHKVYECKDSVSDMKRGGVLTRERGSAKCRQDQNDDTEFGDSKHSMSGQVRKESRPQRTDLGRKSKHLGGFWGPEKQVWVAKSPSGSTVHVE